MALRDTCVSPSMSYVGLTLILKSVSDLFDVIYKQKNGKRINCGGLDLEVFFLENQANS